jgi:hypothetical protein
LENKKFVDGVSTLTTFVKNDAIITATSKTNFDEKSYQTPSSDD